MTSEERREYQTVVMGALLHNIRPLLERSEFAEKVTGRYSQASSSLVDAWREEFARCLDVDLLKAIVHHPPESEKASETFREEAITHERHRVLATLVSQAENLALGEGVKRIKELRKFQLNPLVPVFNSIRLLSDDEPPTGHLPFAALGRLTHEPAIFSQPGLKISQDELTDHLRDFASAFVDLKEQLNWDKFETVYAHCLSLLCRFASCIANDAQSKLSDVSLYDHLRVTSALAGCFYRYHLAEATLNHNALKNPPPDRCALVVGDLSGIQKYLFDIATVGAGGVARRLRARSFYLQMISEIAALKVLRGLDLPLCNTMMTSGGRFYVLLPRLPDMPDRLSGLQREYEAWFLKELHGTLTLNLAWTPVLDAEFAGEEGGDGFSQVLMRVHCELARRKENRLANVLVDNNQWQEDRFLLEPFPANITVCLACYRFPAERRSVPDGVLDVCVKCYQDARLGRLLPTTRFVGFYDRAVSGTRCFDWAFVVAGEAAELPPNPVLVAALNDTELAPVTGVPATFRFVANHVPHEPDGTPWTFEDIAACRKVPTAEAPHDLIAIVKADVDYLGQVFQEGLRRDTGASGDIPARFAALSRQLDHFFSAWIEWLLRVEFSNVYTVYSGGDDLLLVAPRAEALDLVNRLHGAFARFVQNPELTLSAGVAVVRPRLPLAHTVEFANRALHRAKQAGRNKLCFLDKVVTWSDLRIIEEGAQLLERANPPSAFLYHLLQLSELWERWRQYQEVEGLRAFPILAYTISRNLKRGTELFEWASRLVAFPLSRPESQEAKIMDNLGLIARWILLGRRRGKDGE